MTDKSDFLQEKITEGNEYAESKEQQENETQSKNIGAKSETTNFDEPAINKSEKYVTIINNNKIFNTYGDNPNFISAENIENSNIQGRLESLVSDNNSSDEVIYLNDEKCFEKYVDKFKNSKVLLALIATASLEKIEETNFDFVCNELKEHLDMVVKPSEEDKLSDSPFESRMHLLNEAFLTRTVMKRNTHAGIINTNCICFCNKELALKIRNWLWNMYPQFRNVIVDWLIKLSNIDKWFLCAMAQNGIAEYSSIDFEYSLDSIFPKLYRNPNQSQIATLSFVIERLYEKGINEENVEKMLFDWFGYENSDLWMVGFRLCAKGYAQKCKEKMSEILYKHIFVPYLRKDKCFLYIMGFAHRSEYISKELIDVLCKSFEQKKLKTQKDEVAKIFLWLMLYDLFTTDKTYTQLVFIECADTLEIRRKMRPIIHHILSNFQLRGELFEILNAFLIGYCINSGDWSRIEKFVRELAFTGKKEDFDRTINWLQKSKKNKQLLEFSEYMTMYLYGILSEQK